MKPVVDVVRDAPIVGLLSMEPDREWLDAFIIEAAITLGTLSDALVSVEGERVLFFASVSDVRARCNAVRTMVEKVSKQVLTRAVAQNNSHAQPAPTEHPRRVLVVENDDELLEVACDVLQDAGWTVTAAAGVPQAMAALETQAFDAVLTDIDLAVRAEGLTFANDVSTRWPQSGLVVVSGRHTEGNLRLPDGALLLGKPYQRRQLLASVDSVTTSDRP